MANAAVIGIVVLLMVCCLSSSAAAGSYFGGVIPGTLPELAKLISKSVEDGKCPDDEDQKKRIIEAVQKDFEDAFDPLGQYKDIKLTEAKNLCSPAPAPKKKKEDEDEDEDEDTVTDPKPADTTGSTGEDDEDDEDAEPPLTSGAGGGGTIVQTVPLQGTPNIPTMSSTPAPQAPPAVVTFTPAAFSVALGKKGAICSGTELHKTGPWALAPESDGAKEFDADDYTRWVRLAQEDCVKLDEECEFVSVWKDAGWRGYSADQCTGVTNEPRAATFGAGSKKLTDVTYLPNQTFSPGGSE